MDEETKVLIRKRGVLKGKITGFQNFLNGIKETDEENITDGGVIEIKERIDKIVSISNELEGIQFKIEMNCYDDTKRYEEQSNIGEVISRGYYNAISLAKSLIKRFESKELNENSENNDSASITSQASNMIKLPEIKLPMFDGSCDQWLEFKDIFSSMIHDNPHLNNINKFQYLKASLTGNAAELIKLIEVSSNNYDLAWDLICKAYQDKKMLIDKHLEALCNVEKMNKPSASKIRNLADSTRKHLRALDILEVPTTGWDTIVIHLISNALDEVTATQWDDSKIIGNLPTLEEFLTFLRKRADIIERHDSKRLLKMGRPEKTRGLVVQENNSGSLNGIKEYKCDFCNGSHPNYLCNKFKTMPLSDRISQVKQLKLCNNCLRVGHGSDICKIFAKCKICHKRHNTLIHVDRSNENRVNQSTKSDSEATALAATIPVQTLLPTALIKLKIKNNEYVAARALLDSGSTSSFVTNSLVERLKIKRETVELSVLGLGNCLSQVKEKCNIVIESFYNNFKAELTCFMLEEITSNLPAFSIDGKIFDLPNGLKLADDSFNISAPIELLIGADLFWNLMMSRQFSLGVDAPVLQETQLGWVVTGRLKSIQARKNAVCNFSTSQINNLDIQNQLERFFELENISDVSDWSEENKLCEEHFIKNTKRLPSGRFVVKYPFQSNPDSLGESVLVAKNRLFSIERKFRHNQVFYKFYADFMSEYENLKHMVNLGNLNETSLQGNFLPHHGILKENNITTKLRTVFDASAVTSNGKSLNDCQLKGPIIQDDLVSILLRFRQYQYVVTADIEKMYRQILIDLEQTKYQQILWRNLETNEIQIFKLLTVTYGTKSAPFLATRCLQELGLLCKNSEVSNIIIHDFYVDDLLTGFDDASFAVEVCKLLNTVLSSGCFPLRKWRSNSNEIIEHFKEFQMASESESLILGEDMVSKTLGLLWSSSPDIFIYLIEASENYNLTKRVMLSYISKIFDPLGLLSSTIIIAKVLLQGLWQAKIGWDDPIPYDIKVKWNQLLKELPILNKLEISRHIFCNQAKFIELHGFSDASEKAFGATVYVRSINEYNQITCKLLIAKSKVSPIKPITIPRLELCAAHLLSKLMKKVMKASNKKFENMVYWTDSMIVLGWLNTPAHCLKQFIRNRVAQIQEMSIISSWRHISSGDNPADLVSRGLFPSELIESKLWWHGPSWLSMNESEWPKPKNVDNVIIPDMISCFSLNIKLNFPFERFSKFSMMCRSMGYILRFINNTRQIKSNRKFGSLSADEVENAQETLIKIAQTICFKKEYAALISNKPIDRSGQLLSLNPFIDSAGLLRVGGRLCNSKFMYSKKHPIILPKKHPLTALLFEYEHVRLMHAGPQQLLYSIRENFWPINGRNIARITLHRCLKCFRANPKGIQPIMGNLPSERLESGFPFKLVGVDYAGPFLILNKKGRGAKLIKAWLCIFVCFSSKAVHLELVGDLSSASFLLAFKRFISRRGIPSHIFSDNGTNFIAANKELSQLYNLSKDDSFLEFNSQNHITWKFNPVQAPHFGGLWEAGVKSVKHHLRRVAGTANFTYEEFSTLLIEIESVLNSRPLSPLSSDPADLTPLTPGHFIIGRPLTALPEPSLNHLKEGVLNRFQKIENARQHFWARWYKEFISELQVRCKWKSSHGSLNNGDMVVVKDTNLAPLNWKIGRIVKLIPGSDNINRVAEIQTQQGIIKRDFSRICPLPLKN